MCIRINKIFRHLSKTRVRKVECNIYVCVPRGQTFGWKIWSRYVNVLYRFSVNITRICNKSSTDLIRFHTMKVTHLSYRPDDGFLLFTYTRDGLTFAQKMSCLILHSAMGTLKMRVTVIVKRVCGLSLRGTPLQRNCRLSYKTKTFMKGMFVECECKHNDFPCSMSDICPRFCNTYLEEQDIKHS